MFLLFFSGRCYKEVTRPLLTAAPNRRKPHCIQLVEIPPTPDRGNVQIGTLDPQSPITTRRSHNTTDRSASNNPLIKITE